MIYTTMRTPIGELLLRGDGDGRLQGVQMEPFDVGPWSRADSELDGARSQLEQYFAGERRHFDLELEFEGTPFQRLVWDGLRTIPYGATCSYGELATDIGRRGAARAVGRANNRNPIAIVVPCHRVIGADASLTGYGGGLDRKRWLLEHERACAAAVHRAA